MAFSKIGEFHLENNYYADVLYETISTTNNATTAKSQIRVKLRLRNAITRPSSIEGRYDDSVDGYIEVGGVRYSFSGASYNFNTSSGKQAGATQDLFTAQNINVNHNLTTGAASVGVRVYFGTTSRWFRSGPYPSSVANLTLKPLDRTTPTLSATTATYTANSITVTTKATSSGAVKTVSFWDSASNSWVDVTTTSKTNSKTYSGLKSNTTYRFQTSYQSSTSGLWGYAPIISVTTKRLAPARATVALNSKTTSSLKVTGSATAGATESPVTAYRFAINGEWRAWQSSNTYEFKNLSSFTSYKISAQAKSGNEIGPESTVQTFKTDSTSPAVSNILFSNITKNSVLVNVVAKSQAPIKNYKIFKDNVEVYSGTSMQYSVTGLTSKTRYTIKATVTDEANRTASAQLTVTTKSTPVSGVTIETTSIEQKSIKTQVRVSSAQAGVKLYTFYLDGVKHGTSATNTYTYPNLQAGRLYKLKVEVEDNESNKASHTLDVRTKYAAPVLTNPSVSNITTTSATVSYKQTSGATISGSRYKVDNGSWVNSDTSASVRVTGLTPNKRHLISIEVWNSEGTYSQTLVVEVTTLEDQWVMISKSGGAFVKVNIYIIKDNGQVIKIEKSKSKVIK